MRKNTKDQKYTRLAEQNRYNVALELTIAEEKKNTAHIQSFQRENKDHYDLVMKESFT